MPLDEEFSSLDRQYCSLGQSQQYYEQLNLLPNDLGREILSALRDCAADLDVWNENRLELPMLNSLLRHVTPQHVEVKFRNILLGVATPTHFRFRFESSEQQDQAHSFGIDINVMPGVMPPTNVHVLVGRNGAGKTRLLAGIAETLTGVKGPTSIGITGDIIFPEEAEDAGRFSDLVTVAFSAFDRFNPISSQTLSGSVRYHYVGLGDEASSRQSPEAKNTGLKSLDLLCKEFASSLSACMSRPRHSRWLEAMVILNSDPGFAELGLEAIQIGDDEAIKDAVDTFSRLSSGHKLVLLTTTRLVELVDERTLVLIDEPESHLHPPLLGSFIRALSNLLVQRNGVAVVATHSPVVLQEVPRSCVWVIRRTGHTITAERPKIETFGENVGIITNEVFQFEVTDSGFYRLLAEAAKTNGYDEILSIFGGQIGAEGRAIARVLTLHHSPEGIE